MLSIEDRKMNIFRTIIELIFGINKKRRINDASNNNLPKSNSELQNIEIKSISKYDELTQKIEKQKIESAKWGEEFGHTVKYRNRARKLEENKEYEKAVKVYLSSIDYCENSKKMTISNYAFDIERVIILYGKTKQKEEQKLFLERVISRYPEYRDITKWEVRLAKLIPNDEIPEDTIQIESGFATSLLNKLKRIKSKFPEFNFYYDMPVGMYTLEYLKIKQPVPAGLAKQFRDAKKEIDNLLETMKAIEHNKEYGKAIAIYEEFVKAKYERKEPYERLMILYRKQKQTEEEISFIKETIRFFKEIKQRNLDEVQRLAKKYNAISIMNSYLEENKRIQYFCGFFDIYNPFSIIVKWESRLEKLEVKASE